MVIHVTVKGYYYRPIGRTVAQAHIPANPPAKIEEALTPKFGLRLRLGLEVRVRLVDAYIMMLGIHLLHTCIRVRVRIQSGLGSISFMYTCIRFKPDAFIITIR